jgi:hypothetical protein
VRVRHRRGRPGAGRPERDVLVRLVSWAGEGEVGGRGRTADTELEGVYALTGWDSKRSS